MMEKSEKKIHFSSLLALLISLLLFALLFFGIAKLFRFLLNDDVSYYTRVMMHELYEEENIDVLFIGSSHCLRSLNPALADPVFKKHTFNGGTSHQRMDGSLCVLRECAANHDLKEVYVELFYGTNPDVFRERNSMTGTYILSDYIHFSPRKVLYLLNASAPKHYVNSFLIAARERERLADPEDVWKSVKKKLEAPYRNYTYENLTSEEEAYLGRGYVASWEENPEGGICHDPYGVTFNGRLLSEDTIRCMREMIDFCRSRGIRIIFFSSPMPDFRLCAIGNYDAYIEEVERALEGTGARYYDFNLARPEHLSLSVSDYMDSGHLNDKGAGTFTPVFSAFFSGKLTEEELFFPTYEEKLRSTEHKLLGFIKVKAPESGILSLKPVTTDPGKEITLQITMNPDPDPENPGEKAPESRTYTLKSTDMFYLSFPPKENGLASIDTVIDGRTVWHFDLGY